MVFLHPDTEYRRIQHTHPQLGRRNYLRFYFRRLRRSVIMPCRFDSNDTPSTDADRNVLATPVEVAKMLCVQPTWVYAHQQELPGLLRLGRYVRFRRAAIEEFVKGK